MVINDIRDFEEWFPFVRQKSNEEWESPSPLDPREGESGYQYGDATFYGEDRFVWNLNLQCFFYRNHPDGSGFKRFSPEEVLQALKQNIEIDIKRTDYKPVIRDLQPLSRLWTRLDVIRSHLRVDRSYWYSYGLSDATINRFRLGRGELFNWAGETPIIPARVTYLSGQEELNYYVFARSQNGWVSSSGSKTQIMWLIQDDPSSKELILVEGPRDVLTAWELGYRNIACYMGQGGWSLEKSEYVSSLGYEKVYVVTDNDEAGFQYRENCKKWFSPLPLKLYVIQWWDGLKSGYDLSDFYKDYKEETYTLLQNYFKHIKNILRPARIKEIDPSLISEDRNFLSIDEVRGRGENSIYYSLKDYITKYNGEYLNTTRLVSSPPGTGKTYTSIQVVEEVADQYYAIRFERYKKLLETKQKMEDTLKSDVEELEKMALTRQLRNIEFTINNFDWSTISWYGQYKQGYDDLLDAGANPEKWFNFEGRNEHNCRNLPTASELGSKNHDVYSYCNTLCPYRKECREDGYLNQYREKIKYPIVFYRHQHLVSGGSTGSSELVVIDENPHGVIDNYFIEVLPQHLNPSRSGWDLDVEETEQVYFIEIFVEALKEVVVESYKNEFVYSGVDIYRLFDEEIQEKDPELNIKLVLEKIDYHVLNNQYQPSYLYQDGDSLLIPLRCVPQIYLTMVREIDHYPFSEGEQWNSVFHLSKGVLRFYPAELPSIRRSTPIVCLDATPEPSITKLMFNRNVSLYKPDVKSDTTTTTVILGSDYTKGTRTRYYENKLKAWELKRTKEDHIPEDLLDSPLTKKLIKRIQFIADKHDSLLVVTFKELRYLLEDLFKDQNKIVVDHYGNVRGTNRYEDFQAVLLIGAYRIPYDIIRERAQVWLSLSKRKDLIPEETTIKIAAYDGTREGHTYRSFEHEFGDTYVRFIEEGEVRQSAARIRAHTTEDEKYIYIMANRPLLEYTDVVTTDRLFFQESKQQTKSQEIKEYVEGLWESEQKTPTYKELAEKFGVSNSLISYVMRQLKNKGE